MTENVQTPVLPPELNPRGRPAATGHPGRRRTARVLSWIAVITSLTVLVGSGVGYLAIKYYFGKVNKIEVPVDPASANGTNFLLIGSDSRAGATAAELKEFSTNFVGGRRSDTMILIHVSAKRDKALLVSFPRDAWVDIPAHGKRGAHKGRINTAFGEGGPALAIKTVQKLTGVPIHHYIEVNFAGFFRMVESLDGVDVCLPKAQKEPDSGINLPAGRSRVHGQQALAFVRQRNGLPRGDIDRIARQQQFLGAMMRRATSAGTLLNPFKLTKFLTVVSESIQVDSKMSFNTMKDLALKLRNLDPGRVTFVTAPVDRLTRTDGGASVILLDEIEGKLLYDAIKNDDKIPGADPAPAVPKDLVVPPSSIRVRVLNGTDINGFARKAGGDLTGVGFRVTEVTDADAHNYQDTIVRYGPDRADSARTLAAAIPGSKLQLDQSLTRTLELVVGRSYAGARKVTVAQPTAPQPGSTKKPAVTTAADDPCA